MFVITDVEVVVQPSTVPGKTQKCIMLFSAMCNGGDTWVQCDNCSMWAHTLCVGMPDDSSTIPFSCCGNSTVNPM